MTDVDFGSMAMSIVMVRLIHDSNPQNEVVVYAALDSMSSASFISEEVLNKLGVPGVPTEITIRTVSDSCRQSTLAVSNLKVSSVFKNDFVRLPRVYKQTNLPLDINEVVSHEMLLKWPHLHCLLSEIPDRNKNVPLGLLIGINCPRALQPHDVISSVDDGPFAVKTILGWCISGSTQQNNGCLSDVMSCFRIRSNEKQVRTTETGLKVMIRQMYENEFNESMSRDLFANTPGYTKSGSSEGMALSQEDRMFLNMMENESRFIDGHYQLPLPFRNRDVSMPNNRTQALQRINGLKKRFSCDSKFRDDYTKFMKDIIEKGYARKVNTKCHHSENGMRWYIPHHGVYHPQKPGKIRVVFDCSCQFNGRSLNKELLQGPDLTNSLVGVLTRFRQEPIAFMADIESMFCQVRVPESQLDFLRFLWWTDGNTDMEPDDYQMQVHLFGAISSPSCSNFALRKTADDHETKFGAVVANTLRTNFYVDDLLKSVEDVPKAVNEVIAIQQICSAGGFHLGKFVSNDRRVLEAIPCSGRANNISSVDLSQAMLPMERALGVHWCVENDTLGFRITLKDKPLTRRGVLSTISSIYDPLGLAAPFLMTGKKLLQRLCGSRMDWDDDIDGDDRALWEQWRYDLPLLENIQVPRCFKPPNFNGLSSVGLHHFSDASQTGYGQSSYLRVVDVDGRVHCSLVMGKSRVSPLKPMTIPRLELTAATVSVKVGSMLETELQYKNLSSTYWTDSKVVLGYINNDARRFHMFVANRVQFIREKSDSKAWRYVSTEHNPADDASRGISCFNICIEHRWFQGPQFLWEPENHWPSSSMINTLSEDDPNVRAHVVACVTHVEENNIIDRLFCTWSSWYCLKKGVAWILVSIKQLGNKTLGLATRDMSLGLTVDELDDAELQILRYIQRKTFVDELAALKRVGAAAMHTVKKSSSIYRLSPVLSDRDLLCVGGRLSRGSFSDVRVHPIIMPGKHFGTSLLVNHFHVTSGHSGREFVLSLIRQKFWIVGARRLIRQVLKKCSICRKCFAPPCAQRMADLPMERVTPDKPPFTYVGIDFFGPYMIKIGRSEVKRYGCIFTCLAVRAVHIEVVSSLEADSFINALQRFICRRGPPTEIRSDNGTNFVGGEKELRQAAQSWNKSQVHEFMRQKEIRWKFNPPGASHMGGVWERQIRTIRKILATLLRQQPLSDEVLSTLMCVVENIINSRPLTTTSDDPNDMEPLTPNHLFHLRSGSMVPPFSKQDIFCRRRWRQVQYMADQFWKRWTNEYLPTLQKRTKWLKEERNVQVDDVVLVVDENLPRNSWLLGRVYSTYPGADGFVRTVQVKTKNAVMMRPVHKICIVESRCD